MRVMMLTPVFDNGGTEVYILNLIKFLKDSNIDIKLLSGEGVRVGELAQKDINHKVIAELRSKKVINTFKSISKVYKEIKIYNPDIIHTSSIFTTIIAKVSSSIYNVGKRKKVRIINTLHGGPNRNIEKQSAKILNVFSDKVIALCEKSKIDLVKNGLNEDKIAVVYNGIYVNHNHNVNDIDINNEKVKILTVGRLTEQKGQIYLIRAIKELIKKHRNFELHILGNGELKQTLEDEIKKLNLDDYIKLIGFKSSVYDDLNQCDIFILPSLWEQFPITVLEAMYFKRPIIASDVNGVREQLDDSGILIEAKDIDAIVEKISYFIENSGERTRFGNMARERFDKNFTLEKMGSNTVKIYKEITEDRIN